MEENSTKNFAFILGREKDLAQAELKVVLSYFGFCFDITSINGNILFANIDNFQKSDAINVINRLGGTVKIFEILGKRENNLNEQIIDIILDKKSESKLNFGISWFCKNAASNPFQFGLTIKKGLKANGASVRFIESKEPEVSSILSVKNDLDDKGIEIGVFGLTVGKLIAISNPYEWSKRDYDKPCSDKKSGMVPPKLARIMVNLALGQLDISIVDKDKSTLVADFFCGSGNILSEALMLNCDVLGSDISAKAVRDTNANIDWLIEKYDLKDRQHTVIEADAMREDLSDTVRNTEQMKNKNYDHLVVVSEPFLGEPKKFMPSLSSAIGEYQKLKELYLTSLKNISMLENHIVVCLVFPLIETAEKKRLSLYRESVDEIEKLGYTQTCSFVYGREYQVVKREIVFLAI